jgi:hypothetical protein
MLCGLRVLRNPSTRGDGQGFNDLIFAQQTPIAPRSICHLATIGDLCVLAWGRSFMPAASASPCARSMFRVARA